MKTHYKMIRSSTQYKSFPQHRPVGLNVGHTMAHNNQWTIIMNQMAPNICGFVPHCGTLKRSGIAPITLRKLNSQK